MKSQGSDQEIRDLYLRNSPSVSGDEIWEAVQRRLTVSTYVPERASAPRRTSGLRITVYASIAVVLVAAVAIGSLEAVKYLGKGTPVVYITDDTMIGSTPGSTPGQVTQRPGEAPTRLAVGAGMVPGMVAATADGSLWAWGYDTTSPLSFARVGSDTDWVAVAAGGNRGDSYLALKSGGTLWAWGSNGQGQLGDGTTTDRSFPVRVGSDTDWSAIAAGRMRSMAVKSDGSLWEWGFLSGDPYAIGPNTVEPSPIRVGSDTDWVSVSANGDQYLALKSDGSLWQWGWNYLDDEGDGGTYSNLDSPTRVGSDADWVAIAAGSNSLALKSDGSLWKWGVNIGDPFADGTTVSASPTRVGSDTDWAAIAAGDSHSLALKSDGTLWAWGDNLFGQVGDGTGETRGSPVQVGSDTDWVAIAAGGARSLAHKADGSLWAWGDSMGLLSPDDPANTGGGRRTPLQILTTLGTPVESGPAWRGVPWAVAMDSQSGRVVVFEPESKTTWTFDVRTNTWQAMKPAQEPELGRWARAVYDADADLTIAFPVDGVTPWTYSVETNVWTQLPAATSLPGTFWDLDNIAYDPLSGSLLLRDSSTMGLWAYAVETNTWTKVDQGGDVPTQNSEAMPLFPAGFHALLVYDAAADRLVLTSLNGGGAWTFDLDAHVWTKKAAAAPSMNTGFIDLGGEVTYDIANGRTVVFSDGVLAMYDAAADDWTVIHSGPGWPPSGVSDGLPTGPLARLYHKLVYDPINKRILMLGGESRTPSGGWQDLGDVWAYDLFTNTWTDLVGAQSK